MMQLLVGSVSSSTTPPAPGGGGGGATSYTVTVAAGKVASDLTAFPLMIDLADMPASFWASVRPDGGNLRAYQSDGATLVPLDVTYINVPDQIGRCFVKHTLTAATDTVIQLDLLSAGTTALSPSDPNGRNNVWSDYEVVTVFPETLNRVNGNAPSQPGSKVAQYDWKETKSVSVTMNQGAAYDGTHYYAVSTNALNKYTSSGAFVVGNSDPVGDVKTAASSPNLNHCGAPDIIDGELWVPVQKYPNSPYNTQFIGRYSLADLTFIGHLELTGATRESSGFYYDSSLDRLYVTDYTVDGNIPYFSKTTGAYQGNLPLSINIANMQGMTKLNGKYYVNSGGHGVYEVETNGNVNGLILNSFYSGDDEAVFAYGSELLHCQDSGYIRHYSRDTFDRDWARIHGTPLGHTAPRVTLWTASVSWSPTPSIVQQGIVGVADDANSGSDRHSLMFDAGPDRIDAWRPSDSWMAPSPGVNPNSYVGYRVALGQNNGTERKLWIDGAVSSTDVGGTARPTGGANLRVEIAGCANGQNGYGSFQFGWLRGEYMSDDWMAADSANVSSPATFYTIAEI